MTEKRFELVEAIYNEIGKHQIEIMDNLEKHIVEKHKVVDLINSLYEENEQLRKQVDNLQDNLAEICATLIMNGFEIEFDGKNVSELIDDE